MSNDPATAAPANTGEVSDPDSAETSGALAAADRAQQYMWRKKCRELSDAKQKAASAHDKMIIATARAHDARLRYKSAEGSLRAIGRDLADYAKEAGLELNGRDPVTVILESHRDLREKLDAAVNAALEKEAEADRLWRVLNELRRR